MPAVETAWTRNGEERAPTSASRFTRDADSCVHSDSNSINTPDPRAQGRFLLKRGVRTCAAGKVYSSPTPSDSPCYHGIISPTVVSSERF